MSMLKTNTIDSTRSLSYVDALREAIMQEMERDKRIFLFGLGVDDHKGIQGSTLGLQEKFGSDRVFDTPLSENAMTGVGIGAAMAGMRPIHVHIRMDFLLLCMNQLINMAAKMSYMYDGQVKIPLVVRCMIGRSWGQGGQHSQALHAFFMHVPGLKVVAPSNAHDAKACMIAAIRDNNPVIFIEHRLLYSKEHYVKDALIIPELGKSRILCEGSDITIVAISHMVVEALRAKTLLEGVGISAEIIDPITLKPLDIDTISQSVKKTRRLLVVDNGWLTCGASSEIITQVIESLQSHEMIKVARLGFAHTTCPTTRSLEDYFYPNSCSISLKAAELVAELVKGESISKSLNFAEKVNQTEIDEFKGPF
jgi:acetoin:2,6-dichlorophenolindophenol oxidoreductase subunit beta